MPKPDTTSAKSSDLPARGSSTYRTTRVLLLAVFLLCISIAFIYQTGLVAIQANRDRTTEMDDLEKLGQFNSTLKDIEIGERGYLLTGDEAYLAPWHEGFRQLADDLNAFHEMGQSGNLPMEQVEPVIQQARAFLTIMIGTVEMRRTNGFEAAVAMLQHKRSEAFSTRIRVEIAQMKIEKEKQFAEATRRANRATFDRNVAFIGVGLLNVIVLLCAARMINRESRRREAAIRKVHRQEERYRTLFDSMDEGFCVIEMIHDASGQPTDFRFLEINPAFQHQTGITAAQGKTMREIAPLHEQQWYDIYGRVALTGEPIRFEKQARSLNRWFDVYAFRTGRPEERKVAILFTDISRRKQSEAALARAQAELEIHAHDLERLVAERTAHLQQTVADLEGFSYTVSHDLRSPLRAMQGFAHALMAGYADKLDDQGRGFLKRISDAAVRLDKLILEVLTYSRVGRAELTIKPVDMEELLDEVTTTYPSIRDSGAEIQVEHPLHPVLASHASLAQGVSNLLTNAVKFVPKGEKPHVHIWTEKHDSTVRFSVEDRGIGIPQNLLPKIFEPFQRAHPQAGYEGTGMGLAIVRKAMQRMGGTVGVQSEEGKGSTFWIELPAAA